VIERADAETSPPVFVTAGTVELQDRTRYRQERRLEYTDTGVAPEGEYIYRVRARTLDGYDSSWAGPARVRFRPGPAEPETPQ
jgi:hypothetical protein